MITLVDWFLIPNSIEDSIHVESELTYVRSKDTFSLFSRLFNTQRQFFDSGQSTYHLILRRDEIYNILHKRVHRFGHKNKVIKYLIDHNSVSKCMLLCVDIAFPTRHKWVHSSVVKKRLSYKRSYYIILCIYIRNSNTYIRLLWSSFWEDIF